MGFVDSGAVDFDTAVNLTRGVGQTMARLADWEVSTLVSRVEEMEAGEEATGSRIGSALRLIDEVNPPFERLLVYAWRRHLAAAVAPDRGDGSQGRGPPHDRRHRRVRRPGVLHRAVQHPRP